ncbi:MAG: tRNA (guanine(10)-N(2))-dimethyltransferase [Candidatus Micrarchaeota archaeon]
MEEEKAKFQVSGVFYNPEMRFCRSMSSLAVGAIGEKIEVVDAFCASGIRGIRYAKENRNVKKLTFIDIEKKAIALAKKNARANRMKSDGAALNISRAAFGYDADFLEIDPFGTPSPYLNDALRFFNPKKSGYLSVTATDVAVLCGAKVAPCMKNYHSKPLNNEFTHETGLRIMIKRIAEVAAEFNMGITPLVSFSDRHYLKSVLHLRRSADLAYDSLKKIGHVFFCKSCGNRDSAPFPPDMCSECGMENDYAGPLWLGELHDPDFIAKMAELNRARAYADRAELANSLSLMAGEAGMPPFYYNVHALCRIARSVSVPALDFVLGGLRAQGYIAVRTHFSPICIKTDAPYRAVKEAIGWRS